MDTGRDLACPALWQESLERSLARRGRPTRSSLELFNLRPERDLSRPDLLRESLTYSQLRRSAVRRQSMAVPGAGGISALALLAATTLPGLLGGRADGRQRLTYRADATDARLANAPVAGLLVDPSLATKAARALGAATPAPAATPTVARDQARPAAAPPAAAPPAAKPAHVATARPVGHPHVSAASSTTPVQDHHGAETRRARTRRDSSRRRQGYRPHAERRGRARGAQAFRSSGSGARGTPAHRAPEHGRRRDRGRLAAADPDAPTAGAGAFGRERDDRPAPGEHGASRPQATGAHPAGGSSTRPVREPAGRRPRDPRADRPGRRLLGLGHARRDRQREGDLRRHKRYRLARRVHRVPAHRRARTQVATCFYAESITPAPGLHVGQTVRAGQPIASIHGGIEIGWGSGVGTQPAAQADGQWSGGDDAGNKATADGKSFSALIAQLGGPPGKVEG